MFQSTLPRRERQLGYILQECAIAVSIHAPAKGATFIHHLRFFPDLVSIHAPAKGATMHQDTVRIHLISFNPRSREGSDYRGNTSERYSRDVSIHAPAKGATFTTCLPSPQRGVSIHAPAKGATFGNFYFSNKHTSFNPRSREGSDDIAFKNPFADGVSIHAPAKGATASRPCNRY